MDKPDLLEFLTKRMSMTDVYQPVLIKELLLHDGRRTKTELASALAAYDLSVREYYERIVMRWPKITLSKHGIIDYERSGSIFHLLPYAEALFPDLVRLGFSDFGGYQALTSRTLETWHNGASAVAQGRYEDGSITCISDIVSRDVDGFVLTEIKSGTSAKPEHTFDLAFQRVVLEGAGLSPCPAQRRASGVHGVDEPFRCAFPISVSTAS